jgi:NAD(P)H-hydrate repair Nnr-like enzyme with NAD(P)H-hydrate dehydratase domain
MISGKAVLTSHLGEIARLAGIRIVEILVAIGAVEREFREINPHGRLPTNES